MAESALFQSYRATDKAKAERALDEALGRLEAQEAAAEQPAAVEPAHPAAVPEPRVIRASHQPEARQPGVFESIKRGLGAIGQRYTEGIDTIGGVLYPVTPAERGELPADASAAEKILNHPAARLVLGGLNVVFPFTAFAGEVGGDAHEWLARASGDLTDEKLQTARAQAEQNAPGTVPIIDGLLAIPYEERIKRTREIGSISSELLAGVVPGYTSR